VTAGDRWASGPAYEAYVGRWSRLVAPPFLAWLGVGRHATWLDVGCGTGVLTEAILQERDPQAIHAIDRSAPFVADSADRIGDPRVYFAVGEAERLPLEEAAVDAVVSGLVMNFLPDAVAAVAEQRRVARPGGVVAAYVWDYADRMQLLRHFWDAAAALDPGARDLDEGVRFPIARREALHDAFRSGGLTDVATRAFDARTPFTDFDDLWRPFLAGTGPAPAYVASLDDERRSRLRQRLLASVPVAADGSISLVARAWGVRGVVRS